MNQDLHLHAIRTPALALTYYLVPWDTQIVGAPVAQISELRVLEPGQAASDYQQFADWCADTGVVLCACRLPADRLAETMFLEQWGFRFIELNYAPQLTGLQSRQFPDGKASIEPATSADRDILAAMAGQVFPFGRFHQDPRIDRALGDRRYRTWMVNAFTNPRQRVLKCVQEGSIVGFFVVELPEPTHCFWSLTGLAPGLAGHGMGKQVWHAMLNQQRREGIDTVSTSISSHNVPVVNLYVSLGFRFPQPSITLQWRPAGSGVLS